VLAIAASILAWLVAQPPAAARPVRWRAPRPRVVLDPSWATSPAVRYSNLSDDACLGELTARSIHFEALPRVRGVRTPIRLRGDLRAVQFVARIRPEARGRTTEEVVDCRLALALDDLAGIARAHGVTEVRYFSAFRPNFETSSERGAARHAGALAFDLERLDRPAELGGPLDVRAAWTAARDEPPCAPTIRTSRSERERALRAFFCAIDDARLFNVMLTPNYDADHDNHLHLELRRGVRWRLVL
jgi:hypothetical protein